MVHGFQDLGFPQATTEVQGPQNLQGVLARTASQSGGQIRNQRCIMPVGQKAQCGLANPAVGVGEAFDQLHSGETRHVFRRCRLTAFAFESVDAAVIGVHLPFLIAEVINLLVIPVAHVNRAVRAHLDVHRTEPTIVAGHGAGNVAGAEG